MEVLTSTLGPRLYLLPIVAALLIHAGCGTSGKPSIPSEEPKREPASAALDAGEPGLLPPATSPNAKPAYDIGDPEGEPEPAQPTVVLPPLSTRQTDDAEIRRRLIELGGSDPAARGAAAEYFDQNVDDAVALLLGMTQDESPEVRRGAAFGLLGRFDPAYPQMVDAFIVLLADQDSTVRNIALTAVTELSDRQIRPALPALVKMLVSAEEEQPIRLKVIRLLGRLGSDARGAWDAVVKVVREDDDPGVRLATLSVLVRVGQDEAAAAVMAELLKSDNDATIRRLSAVRLGRLGEKAQAAVPALTSALEDKDEQVRQAAKIALAQINEAK